MALPPTLCAVKASPDCEVVGGIYAVTKEGRRVRACVPCASTLLPPKRRGQWGYDGDSDKDTDADTDEAAEASALEKALRTIVELNGKLERAARAMAQKPAPVLPESEARAKLARAERTMDSLRRQLIEVRAELRFARAQPPRPAPLADIPMEVEPPDLEDTEATWRTARALEQARQATDWERNRRQVRAAYGRKPEVTPPEPDAQILELLAIADELVALYDAAMYNEGHARADADALLGRYERAKRR